MGHPAELTQMITKKVEVDYPPDKYRYIHDKSLSGAPSRVRPDIQVVNGAGVVCAVEIGYTRPEKLALYRQSGIRDIRWYDEHGNLHTPLQKINEIKIEKHVPNKRDEYKYAFIGNYGSWAVPTKCMDDNWKLLDLALVEWNRLAGSKNDSACFCDSVPDGDPLACAGLGCDPADQEGERPDHDEYGGLKCLTQWCGEKKSCASECKGCEAICPIAAAEEEEDGEFHLDLMCMESSVAHVFYNDKRVIVIKFCDYCDHAEIAAMDDPFYNIPDFEDLEKRHYRERYKRRPVDADGKIMLDEHECSMAVHYGQIFGKPVFSFDELAEWCREAYGLSVGFDDMQKFLP